MGLSLEDIGKATGIGLTSFGGFQQARAFRDEGEAISDASRFNVASLQRARAEEQRALGKRKRRIASQGRVAIAKSGLKAEGTPLMALEDTISELERDMLNARLAFDDRIALETARGKNAKRRGRTLAGASLFDALGRGVTTAVLPGLLRR